MKLWLRLLAVMLAWLSTSAHAEWHEASTDHFLIYADQSEDEVRRFADRLERYHEAMRTQFGQPASKPSPSNRVTVFVVKNQKEVKELYKGDARFVGGFYQAKAGGSFAIVPRVENAGREVSNTERTLFHEYAHHFLISSSSFTYPLWVTEGFAEFYSSTKFERDGGVGLGLPAAHRAAEMYFSKNIPAKLMLDTKAYLATRDDKHDEFYGRSWLLFHMLRFDETRKGQLRDFLLAIQNGKSELEAATAAFGDLAKLEKDMDNYMRRRSLPYFKIEAAKLTIPPITVRALDAGEAASMPLMARMKVSRGKAEFAALVDDTRALATQHPSSAHALALLAEVEHNAGNADAALMAAEKAIAIDPKHLNAQLQRGIALAALAPKADKPEAAWAKARSQFAKVNRMENDHPVPLIWYFRTFVDQGKRPEEDAIAGLEWALALAPFDLSLRFNVARTQMNLGRMDDALLTLQPLVSNPHNARLRSSAAKLIQAIKAGTDNKVDGDTEAEASE